MSRCKGGHDHPYVAAPVGKWWGLFQVLPLAAPGNSGTEPRVLSWHATVGEAEAAASARALHDPSGREDMRYAEGRGEGIRRRKGPKEE